MSDQKRQQQLADQRQHKQSHNRTLAPKKREAPTQSPQIDRVDRVDAVGTWHLYETNHAKKVKSELKYNKRILEDAKCKQPACIGIGSYQYKAVASGPTP